MCTKYANKNVHFYKIKKLNFNNFYNSNDFLPKKANETDINRTQTKKN